MDAALHPKDDTLQPSPGDLSVCLSCASVLVYDRDLVLRAWEGPLPDELKDDIERSQSIIRSMDRRGLHR
jgi:hypothetical protein